MFRVTEAMQTGCALHGHRSKKEDVGIRGHLFLSRLEDVSQWVPFCVQREANASRAGLGLLEQRWRAMQKKMAELDVKVAAGEDWKNMEWLMRFYRGIVYTCLRAWPDPWRTPTTR